MPKQLFQGRAFVAILMMCGIVVIALSGFALLAAPHGRGGAAAEWTLLTLGKEEWEKLHTVFGVLFPFVAAIHLWLNRKPLKNYLLRKLAEKRVEVPRLEPLAALVLCVILAVVALM